MSEVRHITVNPGEKAVISLPGFTLTIEPDHSLHLTHVSHKPAAEAMAEKREAMAALEQRTAVPFDPSGQRVTLTSAPAIGTKIRMGGVPPFKFMEVASVVGGDLPHWFVFDKQGHPWAVRKDIEGWLVFEPPTTEPALADTVVGQDRNCVVMEVLGEAEVGGWAVRTSDKEAVHVLYSGPNRWMRLAKIDV